MGKCDLGAMHVDAAGTKRTTKRIYFNINKAEWCVTFIPNTGVPVERREEHVITAVAVHLNCGKVEFSMEFRG